MLNKNPLVDKYIADFSPAIQELLHQLRQTILEAAPAAKEVISYKIPAYKYYGMLVYFGARKKHLALYPYPSAMEAFQKELAVYDTDAGTIRFPYDQPLPLLLIRKMVTFRLQENKEKEALRKEKRRKK